MPGANISGGVSNLSFAFRGIDKVRRAMHSVFLYHAIEAGMNMGIVNPAMITLYGDIEPELLELATDVVLNRRAGAGERLAEYAEKVKAEQSGGGVKEIAKSQWRSGTVRERIEHAMLKGADEHIVADTLEAYNESGDGLAVIDGMFMPAMERVGELFAAGMMFLPQVVKSARVMRRGVDALKPYLEAGQEKQASKKEKILIATVKGDVHDIGKNIVSVVMSCNGYRIEDLGVMAECDAIVDTALQWGADAIGLSGLITPSLEEMIKVVGELERRGLRIPVILGGATTSPIHTAVKIAPEYSGAVIHSRDASDNITILGSLFGPGGAEYLRSVRESQRVLREGYLSGRSSSDLKPLDEARAAARVKIVDEIVVPQRTGVEVYREYPICEAARYIDWQYFFSSWDIKGHYPELLDDPAKGDGARRLMADAKALLEIIESEKSLSLRGVAGIFPAVRRGDDIVVFERGREVVLPMLRNQSSRSAENLSLADYVYGRGEPDYIGLMAVSAGFGLAELTAQFRAQGDEYNAIMAKFLADRLTEAFAEVVHEDIRRRLWGFESGAPLPVEDILSEKYRGRRMAFGYPASPDHSLKKEAFDLLRAEENTGMKLGDSYMIDPGESLCGLVFADARYFDVGRLGEDQIEDYARRRGVSVEEIKRLLPRNV
jgi:5-methyltetrahydrofolate--homocysteine methyltransferase